MFCEYRKKMKMIDDEGNIICVLMIIVLPAGFQQNHVTMHLVAIADSLTTDQGVVVAVWRTPFDTGERDEVRLWVVRLRLVEEPSTANI